MEGLILQEGLEVAEVIPPHIKALQCLPGSSTQSWWDPVDLAARWTVGAPPGEQPRLAPSYRPMEEKLADAARWEVPADPEEEDTAADITIPTHRKTAGAERAARTEGTAGMEIHIPAATLRPDGARGRPPGRSGRLPGRYMPGEAEPEARGRTPMVLMTGPGEPGAEPTAMDME